MVDTYEGSLLILILYFVTLLCLKGYKLSSRLSGVC